MRYCILILLGVFLAACGQKNTQNQTTEMPKTIDWQGHRGARGLVPENSIPSFLKALEFSAVTTLELDCVLSKDGVVVVTHEPWMSHHICQTPAGTMLTEATAKDYNLYTMSHEEIKSFDCGSMGNERFPEQQAQVVYKPSLAEVVTAVNLYCDTNNRPKPNYNIEIKSSPELEANGFQPDPATMVRVVLAEIERLGIKSSSNLQSFDFRILQEAHVQAPGYPLAMLIGEIGAPKDHIERLGFTPEIYSPYFELLNAEVVRWLHEQNMLVIPWTVNETTQMESLIEMGVDGIITDYPDRIPN